MRLALSVLAVVVAAAFLYWPRRATGDVKRERRYAVLVFWLALVAMLGALLVFPYSHGQYVPFFAVVALVAATLLNGLWLMRRYPGLVQPDWAMRPWSVADWGLILIFILSGLATAFG